VGKYLPAPRNSQGIELVHTNTSPVPRLFGSVNLYECHNLREIENSIAMIFQDNHYLPRSKDAGILVKPNLNSDMCGLTGNTTDLRVLTTVLGFLKNMGYANITVGDGTSCGFFSMGINVISRLKIDKIAERYNVKILDLNNAQFKEVEFDRGNKIRIAKVCFDSELFINLPKLKTHAETGISVCLKNLIGCVVGLDKQKVHKNPCANILKLNEIIRPHVHIVDGLMAMEGTGPSKGKPIRMNWLLSGSNPLLVDMACAELTGFDYKDIPYLRLAEGKGLIKTDDKRQLLSAVRSSHLTRKFEKPKPSLLASLINDPRYRGFFAKLRWNYVHPYFSSLFSSDLVSRALYNLRARQDMFIQKEPEKIQICLDEGICNYCQLCIDYCPTGVGTPSEVGDLRKCIQCLYCYFVCPTKAIRLKGTLGYLLYQINNYAEPIRIQAARKHLTNLKSEDRKL